MAGKSKKAYIPLRDRLILNFLFFGVVIILVVGAFSYYTARGVLLDRTFDQLTSVKVVKKRQIESFFADRFRDLKMVLASDDARRLIEIMESSGPDDPEFEAEVLKVYSIYLDRYLKTQNYYNALYFVSDNRGTIKISINETDSGQGMQFMPHGDFVFDGGFLYTPDDSNILLRDLDSQSPFPGLLMGASMQVNDGLSGLIIMEISMEAINKIMVENNPFEGLGESGESYLVGEDFLMRSNSRFQDNSILKTEVATSAVQLAMQGHDSTALVDDYRGVKVLSSFSQIHINTINWVILAEIDQKEALVPLNAIRNNILIISSFIVLALFLAAVFLSARITSPLVKLTKAAKKIGQGDFKTDIEPGLANEIGDLMNSFTLMADSLEEKNSELKKERFRRLRSAIDGQELERQRLSRELHDGLGQRIIALKLRLENIKSADQCETMRMVKEVKNSVDETIDEVRRMSHDLMPAVLYEFGIATALRNLLEEVSENSGVRGKFSSEGKVEELNKTTKIYLYRIAQEALNNVLKHSGASRIELSIVKDNDQLVMLIEDDGIGFDPMGASGNGLHNMRERSGLLQGYLRIDTIPGGGTKVRVTIPLEEQNI